MSVPITGECSNCQLTRADIELEMTESLEDRPKLEISTPLKKEKQIIFVFENLKLSTLATNPFLSTLLNIQR